MKKHKRLYSEVYFVKNSQNTYKVIIPWDFEPIPEAIQFLSRSESAKSFSDVVEYISGWWYGKGKTSTLMVTEIEIIVPPYLEYIPVDESLYNSLKEEGIDLKIVIGVKVDVKGIEEGNELESIERALKKLSKKDFGNN